LNAYGIVGAIPLTVFDIIKLMLESQMVYATPLQVCMMRVWQPFLCMKHVCTLHKNLISGSNQLFKFAADFEAPFLHWFTLAASLN
jgi:hypothetical protein